MIYARDFDILPGRDVAASLNNLMEHIKTEKRPCTVLFEKGLHYIIADHLPNRKMYITNTIGDDEWKPGETPHENRAGFLLEDLSQITLEGNAAEFVLIGQATNMALLRCRDITIRNICFTSETPDMHELQVVEVGLFHTDFRLDPESRYLRKEERFCFIGEGYCTDFFHARATAHWIGKVNGKDPGRLQRTNHPFCGALKIQERGDHLFRAYYPTTVRFRLGDRYELFDVRRKYNGIFMDHCTGIQLDGIEQNFNYGLALVAQDSDTLHFSNLRFAPKNNSPRLMASVADFLQICMCRGQVTVDSSLFEGAGDDCLNAHGIHFKIVQKENDSITVRFMHPQTHGFNPLRPRDRITFVNPDTLLCRGQATILSSELMDEYQIRLGLDQTENAELGMVIEDIDASPDLIFQGNQIDRIITRGLLVTVRGKVRIRRNVFAHTAMNNILISDDARSWYESGCVKDVRIEENVFQFCPEHTVMIKPENRRHAGAVHSGIIIQNNSVQTPSYWIKSAGRVKLSDHSGARNPKIKMIHSSVDL